MARRELQLVIFTYNLLGLIQETVCHSRYRHRDSQLPYPNDFDSWLQHSTGTTQLYPQCQGCYEVSWWEYWWQAMIALMGILAVVLFSMIIYFSTCGRRNNYRFRFWRSADRAEHEIELGMPERSNSTDFDPASLCAFEPPRYDTVCVEPPKYDEIFTVSHQTPPPPFESPSPSISGSHPSDLTPNDDPHDNHDVVDAGQSLTTRNINSESRQDGSRVNPAFIPDHEDAEEETTPEVSQMISSVTSQRD